MANKNLFQSLRTAILPKATATNDAGAPAYSLAAEAALARMAATGCLNHTHYVSAGTQLERVMELAAGVDADFLARTALYSRRKGLMKDMPALLCAILATRDLDRLIEIFPDVIDNGKMLRNFVQIIRSGVTGRKSLGSAPKRLVRQWLENATDRQLLNASIGNDPSLADIVKMVHPSPGTPSREAFYAWLIGRPYDAVVLPQAIRDFEAWKASGKGEVPDVPFQMLSSQDLGRGEWIGIAKSVSWQTLRMNLNTFSRHGVFESSGMTSLLATRLADADQIRKAKVFPYQLMAAWMNTDQTVPEEIRHALQEAMEVALTNVPEISGQVVVCPDVSGSMGSPATGYRKGASSKVRCMDVATLVAAAFLRKNRKTQVLPFEVNVVDVKLNPWDSVMTNAAKLSSIGGGGTNCAAPLARLNAEKANVDLVIFISDNESWAHPSRARGTVMMEEWEKLRLRNPQAKLVCIDLVPNLTTQVPDRADVLNIAGFSDTVFELIAGFASEEGGPDHWVGEITKQNLKPRMKIA